MYVHIYIATYTSISISLNEIYIISVYKIDDSIGFFDWIRLVLGRNEWIKVLFGSYQYPFKLKLILLLHKTITGHMILLTYCHSLVSLKHYCGTGFLMLYGKSCLKVLTFWLKNSEKVKWLVLSTDSLQL